MLLRTAAEVQRKSIPSPLPPKKPVKQLRGHVPPPNNAGRPGDIAIGEVILNKVPQGEYLRLALQRLHYVYRCCKDGTWMKIGSYSEFFGQPPGDDSMIFEHPCGMVYTEFLGKRIDLDCSHQKYFGSYGPKSNQVHVKDYLIERYKDEPIPRRNTKPYRRQIAKPIDETVY